MAGKKKSSPRLVADDRYGTRKPNGHSTSKSSGKVRASRQKSRKKSGNVVTRAFSWMVKGILGLLWSVFWRVGFVIFLFLATSVGYFAINLPEATTLLDGRARGSVTLMDRNGEVFAWRGEQFGGAADANSVSQTLKNA
ncbi:MAG: glycosyl transferase, partial [Paracoccaceae bacterium]